MNVHMYQLSNVLMLYHLCLLRSLLLGTADFGRLALLELGALGESGRLGQSTADVVFLLDGEDSDDPVFRRERFLCDACGRTSQRGAYRYAVDQRLTDDIQLDRSVGNDLLSNPVDRLTTSKQIGESVAQRRRQQGVVGCEQAEC
jgi:hypothetical protein